MSDQTDLSSMSMHDLFRIETEAQGETLTDGLIALESDWQSSETLESLMRAAHSIKGAARIVNLDEAVRVAHSMEDCFVAAQAGKIMLDPTHIDIFLRGMDMLTRISEVGEGETTEWFSGHKTEIDELIEGLLSILSGEAAAMKSAPVDADETITGEKSDTPPEESTPGQEVDTSDGYEAGTTMPEAEAFASTGAAAIETAVKGPAERKPSKERPSKEEGRERQLRISPEQIDQLLGLAGEVQMQWQWLRPYAGSLLQIKRRITELESTLNNIELSALEGGDGRCYSNNIRDALARTAASRTMLAELLEELENHERSIFDLSQRLYHQSVSTRMQPFSEGVKGFKRMVRDLARSLGKQVRLEVVGADTLIDRDILEKIQASLNHLMRNAIDHGIETPEERLKAGKAAEGTITLEARHHTGMLKVSVSDDGKGIDLKSIGKAVVERGLATQNMVDQMNEAELLAFLYLPKFTIKDKVSEISGRGVGLDVVASTVNEVRGYIHTSFVPGKSTHFELQLPITLSVIRSLQVEIAGEAYAFALARIDRALKLDPDDIRDSGGRQYITIDDRNIGLVSARQFLGIHSPVEVPYDEGLNVVVLGNAEASYGFIVDRFLGECDLVEKALDPRLARVRDISAASIMNDGTPLLIFDVCDLIHSIEKFINDGRLARPEKTHVKSSKDAAKKILVVDDSITVREVERKLLTANGYEVEVAVDGVDGWNTFRDGEFDLVISDVDMPRMDGIELVRNIKMDPGLNNTPIVIVSYKESDEDRMRGLEAGADFYMTKSSFHDEGLLEVVADLIGEAV